MQSKKKGFSLTHNKGELNSELEWNMMMDYLKANPAALLDALPTPPGEEEDEQLLKDFRSGLTPKRSQFKFGSGGLHPDLNRPPNFNHHLKHQSSSLSSRSASSFKGTPYKQTTPLKSSLPKVYQPGNSRPNSSHLQR